MKLFNKIDVPDKMFGMESSLLAVFIPPIGLLLVLIVVFDVVIFPKIGETKDMADKVTSTQTETQNILDKKNYILSINQSDLNKSSSYVNSALLPEKNSYLLVGVIRKIADKYGFQVDSFQIKLGEVVKKDAPTTALDALSRVPVVLRLSGPKPKYLDLVNGLEKSLPILSIDSFALSIKEEIASLDLVVSAYYLGNRTRANMNKVSLADLTLKSDESDLVAKLTRDFTVVQNVNNIMTETKSYVKYSRSDPFNP